MSLYSPHDCARCGKPVPAKKRPNGQTTWNRYCSTLCRRLAVTNMTSGPPCPVKTCTGTLRLSSLAVCRYDWHRVPKNLKDSLVEVKEAWKHSGVTDRDEKRERLEEARAVVIAAAESHRAKQPFDLQAYFRRMERRKRARKHLGLA